MHLHAENIVRHISGNASLCKCIVLLQILSDNKKQNAFKFTIDYMETSLNGSVNASYFIDFWIFFYWKTSQNGLIKN